MLELMEGAPVDFSTDNGPEDFILLLAEWESLDPMVKVTLGNIRILVETYLQNHEDQTDTKSDDYLAWRARQPQMSEEDKSDEHFDMLADLADWIWTVANPSQLISVRNMLTEMLGDTNRALVNHFRGTGINVERSTVDLSKARENLCDQVDNIRGLARQGVFPGLSEEWVLRIKDVELKDRKGSEKGVYTFPRAPKSASEASEKKKNGGQTFRTQNTRVRLYRNGELPTDFPATLGEACTKYFKCSVQDAAKFFDGWSTGAKYTTADGTVWSWELTGT